MIVIGRNISRRTAAIMSKKHIQIKSDVTTDTEQFYERVEHSGRGEAKVIEENERQPATRTVTTITTKPYIVEETSDSQTQKTPHTADSIEAKLKDYDTSQL